VTVWYGTVGFNVHSTQCRSLRRRFYWSYDPTNSDIKW